MHWYEDRDLDLYEDFDEEQHECEKCGEPCEDDICKDCLERMATPDTMIRYGAEDPRMIELNGFFTWFFKPAEIEAILERQFLETKSEYESAKAYAMDDPSAFMAWAKVNA